MKYLTKTGIVLPLCMCFLMFSCVSTKKYNELLQDRDNCKEEIAQLSGENREQKENITELASILEKTAKDLEDAKNELDTLRRNKALLQDELSRLKDSYVQMDSRYKSSVSGKNELSKALQNKEEELRQKEAELAEKEKRVNELQSILDQKDAEMNALKDLVAKALTGFEDKGLTVYTKDGKVYVSMAEKLLFASGSWTVGAQGKEAIRELSKVLAENQDIHVMIEGHTDNIPLKGRGDVKDNWDLSVMRATAIAKILLENKAVEANRVSASGRSEFMPLVENTSSEGRAKNRRTEIILTPNLNQLLKILEN